MGRIGVFGGTFDPIHLGHLILAECAREQMGLDQVLFIPASTPPHKRDGTRSPGKQRIEMVRLAIAGNPAFEVSDLEIVRGGVSYTVDTLRALREIHAQDEVFLLLGSDSLVDLPTWYEPREILELASIAVAHRSGSRPPDFGVLRELVAPDRLGQLERQVVEMPAIDLSSTMIRRRVSEGRSIRYLAPPAVEAFIRAHGLYQPGPSNEPQS